jgi:hypothetical protein
MVGFATIFVLLLLPSSVLLCFCSRVVFYSTEVGLDGVMAILTLFEMQGIYVGSR